MTRIRRKIRVFVRNSFTDPLLFRSEPPTLFSLYILTDSMSVHIWFVTVSSDHRVMFTAFGFVCISRVMSLILSHINLIESHMTNSLNRMKDENYIFLFWSLFNTNPVDSFISTSTFSFIFVCFYWYLLHTRNTIIRISLHIYTSNVIYLFSQVHWWLFRGEVYSFPSLQIDDVTSRKKDKYVAVIYTHLRFFSSFLLLPRR